MIAKKLIVGGVIASTLLLSSCQYMINAMIYSKKTQHCDLIRNSHDTLWTYTEWGGSFPKACEECEADMASYEEDQFNVDSYECSCWTEKDE